ISQFQAGDQVEKGETIGKVKNVFGEVIDEVVATASGTILYKIGTPPVNVGETVVCIGGN
ncbi:MAG: succinylglutamate desuccinylase, partial [Bacteroidota bacterium]